MTAPLLEVEIPGRSLRSPDRHVAAGQWVSLDPGLGITGRFRFVDGYRQAGELLLHLAPVRGEVLTVPAGWVGTVHRELG